MNEVEWLKSLDRAAATPRVVDVTPGVMQAVRSRSISQDNDRVFPVAAVVAAVVGAAAVALVAPSWFAPSDPFAEFGEPLDLVLR
jgi:hypothetical protein